VGAGVSGGATTRPRCPTRKRNRERVGPTRQGGWISWHARDYAFSEWYAGPTRQSTWALVVRAWLRQAGGTRATAPCSAIHSWAARRKELVGPRGR
jgi:hypothetical protein